jgi:acetyl-CoA synthetase
LSIVSNQEKERERSICPILTTKDAVAEAAVVGVHDELTGQAVNAFVALKEGNENNDQLRKDLILQVRKSIGPFAAPKAVFIIEDLPKTRSGKIMRRILRKILAGEEDSLGDTSTVCGYHAVSSEF